MFRLTHSGQALALRPLAPDDASALHAIASDRAVQRMLGGWPWPPDPAFTFTRSRPYDGDGFVWGVFDERDMLGTVAVTGEVLGYMFARAYWGRELGRAAVSFAVGHAFGALRRRQITAECWADNAASIRLLTRLGFRQWQTRYDTARARQFRPELSFGFRLTAQRWAAMEAVDRLGNPTP